MFTRNDLIRLASLAVEGVDGMERHECEEYGLTPVFFDTAKRLLAATGGDPNKVANVVHNAIEDAIQEHVSTRLA